ncbi:hypothetical protein JXA63_03660 [Candidatus Woesebacteria bacterium]|nr:hypothetical protein [Candidatus Woesebacteria bacterium]
MENRDVNTDRPFRENWRESPEQQQKRQEYFENLPFNEKVFRDVLKKLKEIGYFGKGNFEPETVDLDRVIDPPIGKTGLGKTGGKMSVMELTEGGNRHQNFWACQGEGREKGYEVPKDQIHLTINDSGYLTGGVSTYRFERTEDGLKLKGVDEHVRR